MSRNAVVAKLRKLEAITVERGATPAEAETAASLRRRLIREIAYSHAADVTARYRALSPGVHVRIGKARPLP
jgi:uncharacterized protein YqjF (DUF2071 family)